MKSIVKMLLIILFLSTISISFYSQTHIKDFATKPPLGFNSFDSFRSNLDEERAYKLMELMSEKYLPYGYEYFVIDAGWYKTINLYDPRDPGIHGFGFYEVNREYFPNGIKVLADFAHRNGLKFGVWLMRGIPKIAVRENWMIPGTKLYAKDISDTNSICGWNNANFGIDMDRPGSQEYYNILITKLASWGVDFIKVDDMVPNPLEIVAVANAIEDCGRRIIYSISPGDVHFPSHLIYYRHANMLRVTRDIWDDPISIEKSFIAWENFQNISGNGFWTDLDMIPFGRLEVVNKNARQSKFNKDQMKTFIAQRALAASPLIIGGDLLTMDDYSYNLLTNKEMLKCNQNGVTGVNVYRAGNVDVWLTPHRSDPRKGWIGIFNRTKTNRRVSLDKNNLGLIEYVDSYNLMASSKTYKLNCIWTGDEFNIEEKHTFILPADGVAFFSFQSISN